MREYLGYGSFSAVVKAHKDNADYAVKVLVSPAADSLAQNCQFNLEQNILRELNHAQIPKLHEAFAHDGTYYLVLDYIDGYPLSYYLNQGRKFSPAEVIKIVTKGVPVNIIQH
ncbi:MAG TPA: protein kinase [Desulfobacteria bacterium]|nr:protein kinase [Desulfobacteria bacterium]